MRHAEFFGRIKKNEAELAAIWNGCPKQKEVIGDVCFEWHHRSTAGYEIRVSERDRYGAVEAQRLTANQAARLAEILESLEAWKQNEAEWPLSKQAQPQPVRVIVWKCGVCSGGACSGMECMAAGPPICERCRGQGRTAADVKEIQAGQPADGTNWDPLVTT